MRSDVPVSFHQGDLSGTAGTLQHDWEQKHTTLGGDPVLTLQGERTAGRTITIRGRTIERMGPARTLHVADGASIELGDASLQADAIDVRLAEGRDEVEHVDSVGHARTVTRLAAQGSGPALERTLSGDHIGHGFGPHDRVSDVESQGGASLVGRAPGDTGAEPPPESLTGDWIRLELAPDGEPRVTSVSAKGAPARLERGGAAGHQVATGKEIRLETGTSGELDHLLGTGDVDLLDETAATRRRLSAVTADIRLGPQGRGIDALDFEGTPGTMSQEILSPPPAAARSLRARKAALRFDQDGRPLSGTMDGEVLMEDGPTKAQADKAVVEDAPRRTTLTGHASVERAGKISYGDTIVRDDAADTLTVAGTQHTIVRDTKGLPGMEALGTSDEPVYISSQDLVLDEGKHLATYSGDRPSLRRGDTELDADTIRLDDAAGTLDADGTVDSRLRLSAPGQAPPPAGALFDPTRLVHGTSDALHHSRADRLVSYRGHASLSQEGTSLPAETIDVTLAAAGGQVETLLARGGALFKSPDREAEGDSIEYHASDGSVWVRGGRRPARARASRGKETEATGGRPVFVTGALLEITRGGDVRVAATSAGRTRGATPLPATGASGAPAPSPRPTAPRPAPSAPQAGP